MFTRNTGSNLAGSSTLNKGYGVALHIDQDEGAKAEYPGTLSVIRDLRSSGPLWIRSDWLNTGIRCTMLE